MEWNREMGFQLDPEERTRANWLYVHCTRLTKSAKSSGRECFMQRVNSYVFSILLFARLGRFRSLDYAVPRTGASYMPLRTTHIA